MRPENSYPYSFFDMHLHILPEIDDGASSIEETARMLEMEREQGVLYMCATPHYSTKTCYDRKKLLEAYYRVDALIRERFSDMRLYLGNEVYYSAGTLDALKQREALTLNSSSYVLTEFAPDESYSVVYDGIQTLVREGYIPVLAHVERLGCLWKDPARINELKAMFIPFQMNASSIQGSVLSATVRHCRRLIAEGVIDLLGTDAHGSDWRPPDYRGAALWIEKHCGEQALRRMAFENPRRVLDGKLLEK